MGVNGANFLQRFNEIITGGTAFFREVELPLNGHIRTSDDFLPIVTGDVPTWAEDGISFANGETAFLDFDIPQDYDQGLDLCGLRLHLVPAATSADTTDMGVTTAQALYREGAAVDNTVRLAVAETAVASTGALVRESVLSLNGSSYRPGDRVRLTLDANSDGTELILLGIDLIYAGTFAAYNDDDRFDPAG